MRRFPLVVALIACVLCGVPAAASAAGSIAGPPAGGGNDIRYDVIGTAGLAISDTRLESGDIRIIFFEETGIQLTTGSACTDNGNSVTCTVDGDSTPDLDINLGAGNDVVNAGGLSLSRINTEEFPNTGGDDTITGSNVAVHPDGSETGDQLTTREGSDRVVAGAGSDDVLLAGDGIDLVNLGEGEDSIGYVEHGPDPDADALVGGPGTDLLYLRTIVAPAPAFRVELGVSLSVVGSSSPADTLREVEDVQSQEAGPDVLIGDAGPNVLDGGEGEDQLVGGLGSDELLGQEGADQISAQDGLVDRVDGGTGADTCRLDQLDEAADCESTTLVNVTPFGAVFPDVDPAGCAIRGLKRRAPAGRVARRGVSLVADCDEPGRVTAVLTTSVRRAGGVRLAKAGDLELARASKRTGAGDRARLRLKVSRKLRRLVRGGVRLRLAVSSVDAVGNRSKPLVRRLRPKR